MKLYSENKDYKLYHGSMLDMLEVIEPNSIDSIVTDPPYGLTSITKRFGKENSKETQYGKDGSFQRLSKGFMGKEWDGSGIETNPEAWAKCYEVLKPGGYLLAFGGTRTFHRIACAIEDAGFEIRDTIMWLYGSGFPKSLNVGLAIDKKNGIDSKTVRTMGAPCFKDQGEKQKEMGNGKSLTFGQVSNAERLQYEIKEAQNEWNDWGTALKPAYEPIIVARKPCEGSVVENILKYGTGAMNLGACRIPLEDDYEIKTTKRQPLSNNNAPFNSESCGYKPENDIMASANPNGRFPANVIHDGSEEVIKDMPDTKSEGGSGFKDSMFGFSQQKPDVNFHDSGNASRYFKECKFTEKDDEIWKQLLVNNAVSNLEILEATKESIVQLNVKNLLKELKDHYAKYVESQSKLIETNIAQNIVEILNWDLKIETSQVIQDFITNYNVCIQFLNLAQFVEKMDSIDTTQITQNLLKLFGYVRVVITNYIAGNLKCEQKRFLYEPKASVKDREEGLEDFEKQRVYDGDHNYGYANIENDNLGDRIANVKRANVHPTVKPTELMQYLIKLVTRDGGTVLDCFNGSGSTGKAVMFENKERNAGYKYIGIELTEEYLPISKARIEYVCNNDFYFTKGDDGRTEHEVVKKQAGVFDIYDFLGEE